MCILSKLRWALNEILHPDEGVADENMYMKDRVEINPYTIVFFIWWLRTNTPPPCNHGRIGPPSIGFKI